MNQTIIDLFNKLSQIVYVTYSSTFKILQIWDTNERKTLLYTISEADEPSLIDIYNEDVLLANNMNTDMTMRFLVADLDIRNGNYSLESPNKWSLGAKSDKKTVQNITKKRKFVNVKRKRNINFDDLDLDN